MTKNISGKYGEAIVYTDLVEDGALEQVKQLLDMPYTKDANVRMMPDIHAGAGCTIGTTMHITDKICPNLVGVDLGCGMLVYKVMTDITPEQMQKAIEERIPSGRNVRSDYTVFKEMEQVCPNFLDNIKCPIDKDRAMRSMGTLGGGNHFIELNKDETGTKYIVIHSGSRHLGVEVADYYQKKAIKRKDITDEERKAVIDKCKAEGRTKDIKDELDKLKQGHFIDVPDALMWLEGEDMRDYLNDMAIAQRFATLNRTAMLCEILKSTGEYDKVNRNEVDIGWSFTTMHNYIDLDGMILRKGAVSAKKGELLIIPMNMRDGSLLCTGLGNPDWNNSAPHGAGRLMSRAQAKKTFTMDEFKTSMKGISTWSINENTLDECPMAYKPMQSIIDNIKDTVDILSVIRPIYNFKASE